MSKLDYLRPQTTEEALGQLASGAVLAGGVYLTPRRHALSAVIDLQDLDLGEMESVGDRLRVGATVLLEQLRIHPSTPAGLARACRHEAALNIRNQSTIGGLVHVADGRSPLLTALLSLECSISLEPGSQTARLEDWLAASGDGDGSLMTDMSIRLPAKMTFESVARAPLDRPIVCAAASRGADESSLRLSLGGFGDRPVLVESVSDAASAGQWDAVASAARKAFAEAGDVWATREYRSEAAATLAQRVLRKVMG
jgi:putative selenate reductase FAD-binding subunit